MVNTAESINTKEIGGIIDIDNQFDFIDGWYYLLNLDKRVFDSYRAIRMQDHGTNVDSFEVAVEIQNLKTQDLAPEYVGDSEFDNTSDEDQTYEIPSYPLSYQDSTSTTVTKGFSFEGHVKKVALPVILPNGINLQANIDPSTTSETKTSTETKTLVTTPQQIKVPAHKKYRVDTTYVREGITGEIPFKGIGENARSYAVADMSWTGAGFPRPNYDRTFTGNTNEWCDSFPNILKKFVRGIQFDGNNNFTIDGAASLTGIAGMKIEVNTYDITDQATPILVSQKIVNQ